MKQRYAITVLAGFCAGVALTSLLHAQQTIQRQELRKVDLAGKPATEVVMASLEIAPGGKIPRHIHHGAELVYVLEGGSIQVPGKPAVELKTGATLHFAREVPHGGFSVVGGKTIKVLTVHIVDKGKPLLVPVE